MKLKVYPVLIKLLFGLLIVLPLVAGLSYALSYSLGLSGLLSKGFTLDYWQKALTSQNLWVSFLYSLSIGLVSVVTSLCIAVSMALSWNKSIQQGRLSYFIFLPLCFPATVMAFLVLQWLSPSGWFSRIAFELGFICSLNDFPNVVRDFYGVGIIFCSVLLITPFFTILMSNIYRNENLLELEKLSKTLGASSRKTLRCVTLPILFKKSKMTLLLFVIFVMSSYEVPLILGRQYPQMVSVAIVQKIQKFNLNDIPLGFAMSVLYVLLVILVLVLFGKPSRKYLKPNIK
ncbi:ABC transporter permease subunit [Mesohalobacter halotolerans]|uniref:ABC transporter permease subunit n=1 Tax=Mesohalobacter halotolerans TaxID=1883405 RepID=A0A4U5TP23_9FLAO|nr:ABC transporter permease subunit [Mesohalobacter halotolerans]MBS3738018.1 ABC transporter permease subunit [Psychroflexus sp.]TKS55810.1 ABC transporter permease subunit [Mesohalobacter halotolerans]